MYRKKITENFDRLPEDGKRRSDSYEFVPALKMSQY